MIISEERLAQAIIEYDRFLMESLPEPIECKHVFSAAFERKMKKLIRKADHFIAYKVMRYAASILIAFLISASMFLAVNTEARAAVIGWVKEQFQDVYRYFYTAEEVNASSDYVLNWLPEEYQFVDSIEEPTGMSYLYFKNTGELLEFTYVKGADATSFTAGNGEYDQKYIVEGNFCAEIYLSKTSDKSNAIIWTDQTEEIIFSIKAFENEEVLINIAKCVSLEKCNIAKNNF